MTTKSEIPIRVITSPEINFNGTMFINRLVSQTGHTFLKIEESYWDIVVLVFLYYYYVIAIVEMNTLLGELGESTHC